MFEIFAKNKCVQRVIFSRNQNYFIQTNFISFQYGEYRFINLVITEFKFSKAKFIRGFPQIILNFFKFLVDSYSPFYAIQGGNLPRKII